MKPLLHSLLCCLYISASYGQTGRPMSMPQGHAVIIPQYSSYIVPITYQLHEGTARLTDGSLLQGRFMYNKNRTFNYYQDGHSPGKQIPFFQFEYLTLVGADTSVVPRRDSTVFLKVKNRLFRRLTIGKIGLYDDTYAINEDKGKIGDILFTWGDDGKIKRLRTLEQANQWFYEICIQNHWSNPDVFLSKSELIKRLAQLDPVP